MCVGDNLRKGVSIITNKKDTNKKPRKENRVNIVLSDQKSLELDVICFMHKTTKKDYVEKALTEYIQRHEDATQIQILCEVMGDKIKR